ncbi:MAG: hypothetical protein JSW58_09995 [Candidatus Latescibacterota bacterium]|nr:MAG: hypothetical protein JSW58_09995 [Candidatus Latescibacterota bacterium]
MYEQTSDNWNMPLVLLGIVLISIGVLIGLWVVSVTYNVLYHPEDVPILAQLLSVAESDEELFRATRTDDGFTFAGSEGLRGILSLFVLLFLFAALGAIVGGFISGGAKIVAAARRKDMK